MTQEGSFTSLFEAATGEPRRPYPFQQRFAEAAELYQLVKVPTGLGKTAMAVLGWLWRRRFADASIRQATPRRLVYCLPMRVLVEQTKEVACKWLKNLNLVDEVKLTVLMGGEEAEDWDIEPELDRIIIGTQDMLLSRALNRGYGMSRARWPMAFGLLNTDCLWVFDEIQIMGSGLATTAQLHAFRHMLPGPDSPHSKSGHGCKAVWMSATMERNWLKTVDFDPSPLKLTELEADDLKNKEIKKRHEEAKKPLSPASLEIGDLPPLAATVIEEHAVSKGLTLVILNTVKRARELFSNIEKRARRDNALGSCPKLVLLHSRFRPDDRKAKVAELLSPLAGSGTICVSTQVVEAGVDVSATTLFTELAPWASLVQRFGRCNREGNDNERARVFWIDLPHGKKAKDLALPYEEEGLLEARSHLEKCSDVASARLPQVRLTFDPNHVIRRKDLIDLFDTTPDLSGNDIDIDRYVRDIEDSDVHVVWREWDQGTAPFDDKAWRQIARPEICPAPIGEFRAFLTKKRGQVWHWDFLNGHWLLTDSSRIYPGQTYLVRAEAGGYDPDCGWDPANEKPVRPLGPQETADAGTSSDSTDDDPYSELHWQTIAEHTDEVCTKLKAILSEVSLDEGERRSLELAARWHDWGKAHSVFQNAIDDGQAVERRDKTISRRGRPEGWHGCRVVAKAPGRLWKRGELVDRGWWRRYDWPPIEGRKHFRHELASALGVLQLDDTHIPPELRDLVAYLVAAHHGKVRLSIRSLPGERRPSNGLRFARGIWDGDELPATELGGDVVAPAVSLSLEPMELGLCERAPFTGQPSWAERMMRLRDEVWPFRLAYMEAILRAADMRASRDAEQRQQSKHRTTEEAREALHG